MLVGTYKSLRPLWGACLVAALGLTACTLRPPADHNLRDGANGDDWAAYGATYGEQHYSPLAEVTPANVQNLGLAWAMDLQPGLSVVQPLAVDGILYFATGYNIVHAVDVVSGKLLWTYDPDVAGAMDGEFWNGWGSRGIAWWNGKILVATLDGRLIAVDAKTGKAKWTAQTADYLKGYYITGAPRAFDGKVIVGNAGADFADNCTPPNCPVVRGYVTAYDAQTGKQLWRFYTVPGNPAVDQDETTKLAAKSWAGEWWKKGGGGTVWNSMTYDADYHQILLGTGNGAPHSYQERSQGKGDNLFLGSIVAVDADTGAYKWHYQTNPGETWDFNNAMDIQLADLKIGGVARKVLVHAPKNGFVYVLDRKDGKLISAKNWVPTTWASAIDLKTGRPVENPASRDPAKDPSFMMQPNAFGAHSWLPSAFNPKTNILYIPTLYNNPAAYEKKETDKRTGVLRSGDITSLLPTAQKTELTAWDPVAQKPVWRVETPGAINGGVMATGSGLVFQGQVDGKFIARDAATGKALWQFDAQVPVIAPPITYRAGGKQYVTVLTGQGSSSAVLGPQLAEYNIRYDQQRRVLTFVLGGTAKLPAAKPVAPLVFPEDPSFKPDPAAIARGQMTFGLRCITCHGLEAVAAGQAPDVRTSVIPQSAEAFKAVVHGGALNARGMPRFKYMDDAKLEDLRQYIRSRTAQSRQNPQSISTMAAKPPA